MNVGKNGCRKIVTNPWKVGDIYAYRFHSKKATEYGIYNKYILFQKIDDDEWYEGFIFSRVHIYDKIYDKIPLLEDIEKSRLLPIDNPESFINGNAIWPLKFNAVLSLLEEHDYPEKYFSYLCNSLDFPQTPKYKKMFVEHPWKNLEKWLCEYYVMWQKYEYNTTTNSVMTKEGQSVQSKGTEVINDAKKRCN